MDARRRNRRVTIKRLVETQDELGQPVQTWETVATVRADIRYLRGLESIKGGAETATAQASINIGYRTGLTSAMRVEYGATVFGIKSVLPDEAGKTGVDLACEAIA